MGSGINVIYVEKGSGNMNHVGVFRYPHLKPYMFVQFVHQKPKKETGKTRRNSDNES